MAPHSGSWRLIAAASLLLLLCAPHATAQVTPPTQVQNAFLAFALVCPNSFYEVDYRGTVSQTCEFYDMSRDSVYQNPGQPGIGPQAHVTRISATPQNQHGYVVTIGRSYIQSYGGDVVDVPITVQTTPLIDAQDFSFQVLANYTGAGGVVLNQTLQMAAQVNNYDIAHIETQDRVKQAGQFQIVTYTLAVTNDGVFPDVFTFEGKAPTGFEMSVPPSLYVPPRETRNVTYSVLTPHDSIYELGRSVSFEFKAMSTRGTGVYTDVGVLKVSGPYVPTYWIPLTLVGVISAVVVTRKARDRAEIRRLEQGRPRRVGLSPRELVLLEELKRNDPDAYKARKEQLEAVYQQRRASYKVTRREQLAHDREERRQAKIEFREQKKRRAAEAKQARAQRHADLAEAKRADKEAAAEAKAKGKELARKRKELEKAREKQAKLDAKQAAADGKAQARAEREAAKQARAEARAAKKRD